ncbi:hypothetical protein HQ590_09585 [bacterium]|nr:hypothetical protein [bacterium]
MARPRKGDPELMIVSFCDIITISCAAMLMAVIITVFEAVKVPVFKPTPRTVPTDKTAVFFECRNSQVFYLDKADLDVQVQKTISMIDPSVRGGDLTQFLKVIAGKEVGNRYYRVDLKYLLTGQFGLEPREGVSGDTIRDLQSPTNLVFTVLRQIDNNQTYVVFLVRDDSFSVFRRAREMVDRRGFETGWELVGADEAIKFGIGGTIIRPQ